MRIAFYRTGLWQRQGGFVEKRRIFPLFGRNFAFVAFKIS
jgi:hypothetical protein